MFVFYVIMPLLLYGLALASLFGPYLIGVRLACGLHPSDESRETAPITMAAWLFGSLLFAVLVSFSNWQVPDPLRSSSVSIGAYVVGEQLAPYFWLPILLGLPLGYSFGWLWRRQMK
mgnify:CR=1 FL=1